MGWAIFEQPDLVVIEDNLKMINVAQTVRELRRYCPRTVVCAVVRDQDRLADMLDAGATSACRTLPADRMMASLLALVRDPEAFTFTG